jgi:hypothetical protein
MVEGPAELDWLMVKEVLPVLFLLWLHRVPVRTCLSQHWKARRVSGCCSHAAWRTGQHAQQRCSRSQQVGRNCWVYRWAVVADRVQQPRSASADCAAMLQVMSASSCGC